MAKVINIDKYFEKFEDTFSPKIVGELNGQNETVTLHSEIIKYDVPLVSGYNLNRFNCLSVSSGCNEFSNSLSTCKI